MQIDWWTLGLQAVNALVLIWLLAHFLFRPVVDAIGTRQKAAGQLLADAKAAKAAAEGERDKAAAETARLVEHRGEALKAAKAEAATEKSALLAAAQAEADKLRAAAKAEIEAERRTEALKTAGASTYEKKGEEEKNSGEIHLFSDGAFPPLAEFENKNLPLIYHRIGQGCNNLGIVSLDVRANPDNFAQRAIFVSIGNFSTNAERTDLKDTADATFAARKADMNKIEHILGDNVVVYFMWADNVGMAFNGVNGVVGGNGGAMNYVDQDRNVSIFTQWSMTNPS